MLLLAGAIYLSIKKHRLARRYLTKCFLAVTSSTENANLTMKRLEGSELDDGMTMGIICLCQFYYSSYPFEIIEKRSKYLSQYSSAIKLTRATITRVLLNNPPVKFVALTNFALTRSLQQRLQRPPVSQSKNLVFAKNTNLLIQYFLIATCSPGIPRSNPASQTPVSNVVTWSMKLISRIDELYVRRVTVT